MTKLLILGHRGMLGRTIAAYLQGDQNYEVVTTEARWGEPAFETFLQNTTVDFIVNCIGKIPQKSPTEADYKKVNIALPIFLESIGRPIVHASTDCEFKGDIPHGQSYEKNHVRDADDSYGKSKATISKLIEDEFVNTKIIRTSIIGHEEHTSAGLLDWFLSQENSVYGFKNHYWNGITTLQWTKEMIRLIKEWDTEPILNQFGTTTHYSKFDVLTLIKEVYSKNITIKASMTDQTVNKCLASDRDMPDLKVQLMELKTLFEK